MTLRETIDRLCLERLGRLPNLDSPRGYNDLIQWLKIYDQRREHIICCDKWAVRGWVAERAGTEVLIPASLDWPPKRLPAIAKCTHDSGSAKALTKFSMLDRAHRFFSDRLSRPYGVAKGEWAYQFVPPRIIVEEMLPGPIVDFKFHCSGDQVRWVQVIRDRASGKAKETILSPRGDTTGLHMDHKMAHDTIGNVYPGDEAWSRLSDLAVALAKGWRYVRVDLYWSRGQAWFGELTFWPLAGAYLTKDEPRFGDMLDLDLSYRFEPLVA